MAHWEGQSGVWKIIIWMLLLCIRWMGKGEQDIQGYVWVVNLRLPALYCRASFLLCWDGPAFKCHILVTPDHWWDAVGLRSRRWCRWIFPPSGSYPSLPPLTSTRNSLPTCFQTHCFFCLESDYLPLTLLLFLKKLSWDVTSVAELLLTPH